MAQRQGGILFVISAPSGTGKSTVARRLIRELPDLAFSVSYTTRPPRPDEKQGRDYHFVSEQGFESMREGGQFLEWANVHGHLYATGAEETRRALGEGRDLLLDIDVQGARQVREGPIPAVSVMILPPDYATLERRLAGRGTEGPAQTVDRLAQAREEAAEYRFFDFLVVNDDLEHAVAEFSAIVRAERLRTVHRTERARSILAGFPSS